MVRRDSSSAINTRGTATNHVRVVAAGGAGWLFVNDTYVAELDLSGLTASGSLRLLGAWFDGDETAGGVTPFQNFAVRPLGKVYGPTDGSIEHADDGFIDVHRTFTSMADGIIEARFFNPYSAQEGSWSSGFLISSREIQRVSRRHSRRIRPLAPPAANQRHRVRTCRGGREVQSHIHQSVREQPHPDHRHGR